MFVGAVPRPAVEQITRSVPFTEWRQVFVGCSGSFRFDRAVQRRSPDRRRAFERCLAAVLLAGRAGDRRASSRSRSRVGSPSLRTLIAGQPFMARVAAVEVALEMAKYKGANPYAQAHFAHYEERFAEFLAPVWKRLDAFLEGLHIASFHPAISASRRGARPRSAAASRLSRQPTRTGMSGCTASWTKTPTGRGRPTASGTRPKLEDWLDDLDVMRVRYCVLTDHTLEHHQPVTVYRGQIEQAGVHLRGPGRPARCAARARFGAVPLHARSIRLR